MSPLPWSEFRVGLCPDRLVTRDGVHAVSTDGVAELAHLAKHRRLTVVLSNHYVRYAVLPWKDALASNKDWAAFARHTFEAIYGNVTSNWQIRFCSTGARRPRVASAVDSELIEALRAIPRIRSIQPYLMSAFNACRHVIGDQRGIFLVQEPRRLMLGLLAEGTWKRIRVRQTHADFPDALEILLERELVSFPQAACDVVFSWAEAELPAKIGGFRLLDVGGAKANTRPYLMALH